MKNFLFNTICNITQEPQELQRYNRACRFIDKSTVIKINVISCYQKLQVLTGDRFSTRYLVSLSLRLIRSIQIELFNVLYNMSQMTHPGGVK